MLICAKTNYIDIVRVGIYDLDLRTGKRYIQFFLLQVHFYQ